MSDQNEDLKKDNGIGVVVVDVKPQSLFNNSNIYEYYFSQHYHQYGPFTVMSKLAVEYLDDTSSSSSSSSSIDTNPIIVVDLASGGGEPAASIAKLLPNSAIVYSTDILPEMNKLATVMAMTIPNLQTKIVDMQNLQLVFDTNSIDIITCCYGYFFPPDKNKAIQETVAVLKPGGILIAANWYEQKHFDILYDIVQRITGQSYPQQYRFNPQSLSGDTIFEQLLISNGFDPLTIETTIYTYPLNFSNDPDFQLAVLLATDTAKMLQGIDKDIIKSIYAELAPKYFTIEDDMTLVAPNCLYKCTTARKKKNTI